MTRRLVRLEIAIHGRRIVAAACTEGIAPLRGQWRRWSFYDMGGGDRIQTNQIIAGLRKVLRNPAKDSRHG